MTNAPKTVLAIHDLPGFGRAALSVIVPVLSTLGVQAVALPTAVLSTHTGGFENFTFLDMTDEMPKVRPPLRPCCAGAVPPSGHQV